MSAPLLLHLVDLALALSAAELAWRLWRGWRGWRRGRRPDHPSTAARAAMPGMTPAHLLAGLGLMGALRLALAGAEPWAVALCLSGAGLAHLVSAFGLNVFVRRSRADLRCQAGSPLPRGESQPP